MDRVELRQKFSSRVEKCRLEEFELDLHIRPLSALDRAKIVDKHRVLGKDKESDTAMETLTIESQCYIVSRGLVDESGHRIYKDDEVAAIADEFPCKALDEISKRILIISGMLKEDLLKNLPPTPNADSSCVLQ